ncbi:MAG: DinB family protein [Planctomycetes bacterium]|nr:DinB family protein [Planctomycetota bacterium]MCH9727861.1 DinB family protein [Planctomycetota bacterium]MCH9775471.1 DinB family protein [Planctomycetota bacterium]MCH9792779.1 DinB family protein [Planctomycetota bacterium]
MTIADSILPEFDMEMAGTRKTLERIPDDKLDWKAHPDSNTIGWVASHLVEIAGWVEGTLTQDTWDINPEGGEPYKSTPLKSNQEILDQFDANVAKGRKLIEETSDEEYAKSWSLLSAGQPLITMPKIGVIRTWVLNHSMHHRAHLCVYLRLNNIPVPALYGPSGDEQV